MIYSERKKRKPPRCNLTFYSPPSCLWAICSATVSYLFIFNDYCQSSYLKIYQANLCHILWVGKTIAVGDQSEIGYLVPQGTLP